MKGAVKNAINCKLIFEIKADRGRPPRRRVPGDFTLVEFVSSATTSKHCGTPPFVIVFLFPLSRVQFCTTAKLIFRALFREG